MDEATVESFLAVELMEAGVINPRKPDLVEIVEPTTELEKSTWYAIKRNSYSQLCVVSTIESAEAIIKAGPMFVDYDGSIGSEYSYVESAELTIEPVQLYEQSAVARIKPSLAKVKSDRDHNAKESKRYDQECEAMRNAVDGIWEDWRECQGLEVAAQSIEETMVEYVDLCEGDTTKALVFLKKAIGDDAVERAASWLQCVDGYDGPLCDVLIGDDD